MVRTGTAKKIKAIKGESLPLEVDVTKGNQVRKKYENQVLLGRGCRYEDVTNVVVFLARDESSYMTGQSINVTGGEEMR